VDLGKGRSEDARFSEILRLTHGLIVTHEPDLIVIEAPIGGRDANALLIGLASCVRGCAFNRGVKCVSVYPSTCRKHFLGKAKTSRDFPGMSKAKAKLAIKQEVLDRCRLLKWDVSDLDAADAACAWDWACATYAGRVSAPLGGLFDGR
jgi:Holliday junction resolvasome RuvABC endonuclease subunit